MKGKIHRLFLLLAMLPLAVQAQVYNQNEHFGFLKSDIQELKVTSEFGTIYLNDFGGDSVTVDAIMTLETNSEMRAEQLFGLIGVNVYRTGNTLYVQTEINEDFRSKQEFAIDLRINIPKDRKLTVNSRFGNVEVAELTGDANFKLEYGKLKAGKLQASNKPISLELAYGEAEIDSVNRLSAKLSYSKLATAQAGELQLKSNYSGMNLLQVEKLNIKSEYDGIKIGQVGTFQCESVYTNYQVGELQNSFTADSKYGTIQVRAISDHFNLIQLNNSYGNISLAMSKLPYHLQLDCESSEVHFPEDSFTGDKQNENARLTVNGQIGATNAPSRVVVKSHYGGIKLN